MDQTGVLANFPANANVSITTRQTAPEIQELLAQIPDWLKQRQAAINDITRAYDDNPNAKQNGTQAFIKGALMSGTQDAKEMAKNAVDGERAQNDYNLANRVARGNAILKGLDLNAMDNIASQTMRASIGGGSNTPFEGKVVGSYYVVTDRRDGSTTTLAADQLMVLERMKKQYFDALKDQGGISIDDARTKAYELALADITQGRRDVVQMPNTPASSSVPNAVPGRPDTAITPPVAPTLDGVVPAKVNMGKVANADMLTALDAERRTEIPQPPVHPPLSEVANDPRLRPSNVMLDTVQQKATKDKLGKNQADENDVDRKALEDSMKMEQSISPMVEIIKSGKNTAGQLHEKVSALGNLVAYVDPKNSLAQASSNDQVYFSKLMDLVRDKIKALGSGTAVSNLDLIVSQKSVGDLRNNPEGLKKLMALMELSNYTLQDKLHSKLGYWDQGKTYDGWRGNSDPTNIVRIDPKPDGTANYWIQKREDWIEEKVKRGVKREVAEREFARAARQATANVIAGTGIKFAGDK